jgi:hypothetical protein
MPQEINTVSCHSHPNLHSCLQYYLLAMLPILPPPGFPEVVHITSVVAALDKLNVKIPIEDLVKAIRDEDEARHVKLTAEATESITGQSKGKSAPD